LKTIAYLRVSKDEQDLNNQRLAILEYANRHDFGIDEFIEIKISSRKSQKERRIDELLGKLNSGDRVIVSELSRLGRSLGQIIQIVDQFIKERISFVAVKENIVLNKKQGIQTKVMIAMIGLFAEIERDLISERTKQGLAVARAKGKLIGRPKGSLSKSRLDGQEEEIKFLLSKGVPKTKIAKVMNVSRTALYSFIKTRKLE